MVGARHEAHAVARGGLEAAAESTSARAVMRARPEVLERPGVLGEDPARADEPDPDGSLIRALQPWRGAGFAGRLGPLR